MVKEQLIDPGRFCDGVLDCIDRSDESGCKKKYVEFDIELFKTCIVNDKNNYKNHTKNGNSGFQCGSDICLDWNIWCNLEKDQSMRYDKQLIYICPQIIVNIENRQLCSNFAFWKNKACNNGNLNRCRGNFGDNVDLLLILTSRRLNVVTNQTLFFTKIIATNQT